jgi:hypothetical protein
MKYVMDSQGLLNLNCAALITAVTKLEIVAQNYAQCIIEPFEQHLDKF